jgi:signal transduction histidine kinase
MLVSTFSDSPENSENKKRFNFEDTLVRKTLQSALPVNMNIPANLDNQAISLQAYLADLRLKSALLMPLNEKEMNSQGILIFANSRNNAFKQEHVEFLKNISHLVTTSFSRTLQLMDNTRLAAIGGFASSIAHEIRTPLTTITMAIEHFQKADLPENSLKRAHLASEEVHRVTRLLEDMLLYAKPVKLNMQNINVLTFMQNFIQTHKQLIEKKQQTFKLVSKTDETTLYCDPDRLIQVLLNLASNASNAAPAGSTLSFIMEADEERKLIHITLHNEGEIIKVETMSRLTEPFFTTRSGGTGLGLAIVKRIIDMHGGHLSIFSSDNEGTRFTVTFSMV